MNKQFSILLEVNGIPPDSNAYNMEKQNLTPWEMFRWLCQLADDGERHLKLVSVTTIEEDTTVHSNPLENFSPTPEQINSLPEPLRKYIHHLETRSDPAGDVARIWSLEEQVDELCEKILEMKKGQETRKEEELKRLLAERKEDPIESFVSIEPEDS
jgi:hypothetical protein